MAKQAKRKVLVTTEFRGVFFGTLSEWDKENRRCVLLDARNCVYWSSSTKGFIGLAVTGPLQGSRVGPAAPKMEIEKITSVTDCTEEAIKLWEEGKWN